MNKKGLHNQWITRWIVYEHPASYPQQHFTFYTDGIESEVNLLVVL